MMPKPPGQVRVQLQRLLWLAAVAPVFIVQLCAHDASWQDLKAARRAPVEHGQPWRRFGAWWSVSPGGSGNALANVGMPGLVQGEGWYGPNSSAWTDNLGLLRSAGVRRVLLHLPFGKVIGNDMEFTRYVRCIKGYPGVHGPLPWLIKGFVDAMRALRADGVSVVVYYGTMNCFRWNNVNGTAKLLGDTLLRVPFHEIEPHWNLSDPTNPATSGFYKHPAHGCRPCTRGAFNVSVSPRHAALVQRFAELSAAAEAQPVAQLWQGVMSDLATIRDGYSNGTAEHTFVDLFVESLSPLAQGEVDGLGCDSLSTAPPESVFYQIVRLLDAHGIEILAEPLTFGGPSPPQGRWVEGNLWKRFGVVTADRFWKSVHMQPGAATASELDELSVLQRDDTLFNGSTWEARGRQWKQWLDSAPNRCPFVHLTPTRGEATSGLHLNWSWVWQ